MVHGEYLILQRLDFICQHNLPMAELFVLSLHNRTAREFENRFDLQLGR